MMRDFDDLLGKANDGTPLKEEKEKRKILMAEKLPAKSYYKPRPKKPPGMSFEAFRLLSAGATTAPDATEVLTSIMPTKLMGYKSQKAQMGHTRTRKYHWVPFVNQARSDNLQLFHWEREDRKEEEYRFARFNKVLQTETYTEEEYEQYFYSRDWKREETDHLFELCQKFDLRWPVIHDRFDMVKYPKRSIEDMKERYYHIVNYLIFKKNVDAKLTQYDAEHERHRKRQLERQWKRTPEELAEEQELIHWLKFYENKKKVRQQKASELQALMFSLSEDDPFVLPATSSDSQTRVRKSNSRRKIRCFPETPKVSSESTMKYFRVPMFKAAGVHLRSQEHFEFKTKNSRREKNIHAVLEELDLYHQFWRYSSAETVPIFNEMKKNLCMLQDLKENLQAAEYELIVLKNKYPHKIIDILPMFKINTSTLREDEFGNEGQSSTRRRFTPLLQIKD